MNLQKQCFAAHPSVLLALYDIVISCITKNKILELSVLIIHWYSAWYLVAYDLFPNLLCLTPTKQQSAFGKGKREEDGIATRVARPVDGPHVSKAMYRYKQGKVASHWLIPHMKTRILPTASGLLAPH